MQGLVLEILQNRASDDGGPGGPWPLHFLATNAIPRFVDNRFNSLKNPMLIHIQANFPAIGFNSFSADK